MKQVGIMESVANHNIPNRNSLNTFEDNEPCGKSLKPSITSMQDNVEPMIALKRKSNRGFFDIYSSADSLLSKVKLPWSHHFGVEAYF